MQVLCTQFLPFMELIVCAAVIKIKMATKKLRASLTDHPRALLVARMVPDHNQEGLLHSATSRPIENSKVQRIIIGLVSMELILRNFDIVLLVGSSYRVTISRLLGNVGDSNSTRSNLKKDDATTYLINAVDNARMSNSKGISGGGATRTTT